MIYVGIDGGLHGGIVVLNSTGEVVQYYVMPILKLEKNEFDIQEIARLFKTMKAGHGEEIKVCLEKAHTRPIQGIRAAFTTGFGLGLMEGVLESLSISYEVVNPTTWMQNVFAGSYSKENKKYSTIFAQRKWPSINWKVGKNINDGMTDACCIAFHIYLKNKEGNTQ